VTATPEWAARVALEWELCQLTEEATKLRAKLEHARSEGEEEEVVRMLDHVVLQLDQLVRKLP
jgi:hypothetical protein